LGAAAIAALVSLSVAQNAAASSLLVNGGFEAPVQVAPNFATFNIPVGSSTITGWNVVQGNVDLTTTANYGAGPNSLHPSSVQDIDLIGDTNGSGGVFGGLSQSFATVIGQEYRLTFDYSHNNGTQPINQLGDYAAQVTVADANAPANTIFSVEVSQAYVPGQAFGHSIWQAFSQDFTATSALTLLTFIDTRGAFNAGIYLDEVSVELVSPGGATPLPAALPLFASGLGALGLLDWRRKRKNAAIAAA
jgi:hypothetical protein